MAVMQGTVDGRLLSIAFRYATIHFKVTIDVNSTTQIQ